MLQGPLAVEPRSGALVLNGVPGTGTLQVFDPLLRVHVADIDVSGVPAHVGWGGVGDVPSGALHSASRPLAMGGHQW